MDALNGLPEATILRDAEAMAPFLRDESHVRGVPPLAVVRPHGPAALRELVRRAKAEGFGLVPRGAGTGKAGGCVPTERTVVVDLSAWPGDIQVSAQDLCLSAPASAPLRDVKAAAEAQGAKVVFDFSNYIGPFCNTGIMVLPSTIQKDPEMVQALVTSFEEASRKTYADPAFSKEVARKEFPDLPGEVVDKAIDAELKFLIPAQSVVTKQDQWKNLMDMQVYLGNAKGTISFDQIIDNSFADKAVASLK